MPLPRVERTEEYLVKGVELLLRELGLAPEMRSARRLRQSAPPPEAGERRIMIVSPRDWAAHVQYEAMIGHALSLRGATVEFLTCGGGLEICDRSNTYEAPPMPCRSCAKYVHHALDAHGFERRSMAGGWPEHGDWPELDEMAAQDLATVTAEGLPLGHLVDIPLKWFLCAADLTQEPLAGQTHRAFLRSARRIALGIADAYDKFRPDTVLLLNGLFLFEGIAWALARRRGIDVVTYERAFLKETLVFSRSEPAGYYDFGDHWSPEKQLDESADRRLDEYLAARRSGRAFDQYWRFAHDEEGAGSGGKLAVLFTNLTWDTAVIGRDAGFPDIRSWLRAAIEHFEERPEDRLLIRVHPSEKHLPGKRTRDALGDWVHREFPNLPRNIEVIGPDDLRSSYDLMEACDLGIVYSSTTGLELALAGKPVIVGAHVHYRGKGFTIDVSSRAELSEAIDNVFDDTDGWRPDNDLARRYAHFFFFEAPIAAPAVTEPLPGLARISAKSLDTLAPGQNSDVDRICALILGE